MNLIELLKFAPLIIGGILAYHLVFKQNLPSKKIGEILTYFIGIIIVFFAVSWLITTQLANWANDLLDVGTQGETGWTEFVDDSEAVFDGAFADADSGSVQAPAPTPVVQTVENNNGNGNSIVVSPPDGGVAGGGNGSSIIEPVLPGGATSYTVVPGDTLNKLSRQYDVTVDQIRQANRIPPNSDFITVGQILTIPAR